MSFAKDPKVERKQVAIRSQSFSTLKGCKTGNESEEGEEMEMDKKTEKKEEKEGEEGVGGKNLGSGSRMRRDILRYYEMDLYHIEYMQTRSSHRPTHRK